MIVVDDLEPRGVSWVGPHSCVLVSDESARELLAFARLAGLRMSWLVARPVLHFELSPRWRRVAIASGAKAVDQRGLLAAVDRFRVRNGG